MQLLGIANIEESDQDGTAVRQSVGKNKGDSSTRGGDGFSARGSVAEGLRQTCGIAFFPQAFDLRN